MFAISPRNASFTAHAQQPSHNASHSSSHPSTTTAFGSKHFRRGLGKRSDLFNKIAKSKQKDGEAAATATPATNISRSTQYKPALEIRGHIPKSSTFDSNFGGIPGSMEHKNKPTPVTRMKNDADSQYYADADLFLAKVERGFRRLQVANPGMKIEADKGRIKIKILDSYLDLKVENETMGLRYFSNVSEVNTLYFHVGGGEWKNDKDGHSLEGIIIRDQIRKMSGMLVVD